MRFLFLGAAAWVAAALQAAATVICQGTIEQPINLFPVWVGDTWHDRLEAIGEPYALFHDLWRGHGSPEVNALLRSGSSVEWGAQETPEQTSISIGFAEISKEDLAAAIYAAILSVQPTAEKPLEIQLQPHLDATGIAAFVAGSPGWEDGFRCVFVLDPKTRKLLRGSVPGVTVAADGTGGITLMKSEPSPADANAERDRDLYANLYQQQVIFKDFEPTLDEFRKFSPEGKQEGLVWETCLSRPREIAASSRRAAVGVQGQPCPNPRCRVAGRQRPRLQDRQRPVGGLSEGIQRSVDSTRGGGTAAG
jgi:hypothetical protein